MKHFRIKFCGWLLLIVCFSFGKISFANDPCSGTLLPSPVDSCVYVSGTTVGATSSSTSTLPCSSVNGHPDVWYKVVVPSCRPDLTINLLGGSNTGQLPMGVLYVYRNSCNNLTGGGCIPLLAPSYQATVTLYNLVPGDTIMLRVLQYGSAGTFDLCVFGSCPTGLPSFNQPAGKELQVFPNPAKNELSVISNSLLGKSEIEIVNILGQKIVNRESNIIKDTPFTIDISVLRAGIYFLKLKSGPNTEIIKFIKE